MEKNICSICGKVLSDSDLELCKNTTAGYCAECLADEVRRCDVGKCVFCGEFFDLDDLKFTIDGRAVCSTCNNEEELTMCENCGRLENTNGDFSYIDSEDACFCPACIEELNINFCCNCDSSGRELFEYDGRYYCENCRDNLFSTCENCGEIFPSDNLSYVECCDRYLCSTCEEEETRGKMIKNYSYKPEYIFNSTDKDDLNKEFFIGIELEVGGLNSLEKANEVAAEISLKYPNFFYCKYDSSIPVYGFELVTMPATFNAWQQDYRNALEDVLIMMRDAGLRSHDLGEESCGLHIHISRKNGVDDNANKVFRFMKKNQRFFEGFARRGSCYFSNFDTDSWSRYRALNTTNDYTLEYRIFRGSLRLDTVLASVQLIYNLTEYFKGENEDFKPLLDGFLMFASGDKRCEELMKYLSALRLKQPEIFPKAKK